MFGIALVVVAIYILLSVVGYTVDARTSLILEELKKLNDKM